MLVRLSLVGLVSLPLAAQCTFTLTPPSINAPATPDTVGQFEIRASASNCARTAVSSNPDWLTISFGQSGTGNGTVGYRILANVTAQARTGTISVGEARFTVSQAGADCTFELTPPSAQATNAAGAGRFDVATRCRWDAVSNAPWLKITGSASGTGNGPVSYSYDANPGAQQRNGAIAVGGRQFTLTQAGTPCAVQVSPREFDVPAAGGTGSITVTSTCTWTATRSQNWVTITSPSTATGNAAVNFRVDPSTATAQRLASINISGETVTIRQAASDVPEITAVVNAASFAQGAVSPGEIVTVFGRRLGPETLVTYELDPSREFFTKQLAGTRVWFGETPSPMIYTSAGQVSAVAPYDLAGKTAVPLVVEYQGKRSAALNVNVAATAPGLFTLSATGSGPGAILNQDFSVNDAANPAERGSVVMIYATGEGVTNPAGVDGKLVGTDLPRAVAPTQVFIGGAAAQVVYAGGAPGLISGLVQINAILPPAAPSGSAVIVDVRIGGVRAQNGVTVAVR